MSIPGAASPLFIGAAAAAEAGYQIDRSLRFDAGDGAKLTRTPSSAGNRRTFTYSCWVKRTQEDIHGTLLAQTPDANNRFVLALYLGNLYFFASSGGTTTINVNTSNLEFRDPSAWYHIVFVWDTTQSTANDRTKFYVNGVQITDVTYSNQPTQNQEAAINNTSEHTIGHEKTSPNQNLNGYLADVHFIDGQALAATDFGEYDDNNVWQPKAYSGTYGTPVNQAETWSSVIKAGGTSYSPSDSDTGFLSAYAATKAFDFATTSSIAYTNNESVWVYFTPATALTVSSAIRFGARNTVEIKINGTDYSYTGGDTTASQTIRSISFSGSLTEFAIRDDDNSGYSTGLSFLEIDGVLLVDNGITIPDNSFHLDFSDNSSNAALGTDSSGNSNDWTVNNLVATAGVDGAAGFDVVTYTGNGGTQSISSLAFQPDFVWIKGRSHLDPHALFDVVRGVQKRLSSNLTNAEVTSSDGITSFDSNGFTMGANGSNNANNLPYVAWCWKAGGTASSNTDGSITSSVSANTTYGFSIVAYTGNNTSGATIGHGLNAAPDLIFIKRRSGTENWLTYHSSLGATKAVFLNLTDTPHTNAAWFNNTAPSSSVFTLGSGNAVNNANGDTYVAYCWSEVPGFSKFGSYTGDGGTKTITTGFKTAFILIKSYDTVSNWHLLDSERGSAWLEANGSAAENSNSNISITYLDNGFTVNGSNVNNSGTNYIYMAFAGTPDSSVIDSLIDTPTNYEADSGNNGGSYATLNPLQSSGTLSNGNLNLATPTNSNGLSVSTIGMSNGKYYWEVTLSASKNYPVIGIVGADQATAAGNYVGLDSNSWGYQGDGNSRNNNSASSYGSTYTNGDVIGVAFDADTGSLYFYKNGAAQNSGTAVTTSADSGPYFAAVSDYNTSTSDSFIVNFGQRPFAYTPPTGFLSLCTTNLPDPTIADGSTMMDVVLYNGDDSTQSITGLGFSPDFVWIKNRNAARSHNVWDSVRGAGTTIGLSTNTTEAESDYASSYGYLSAFTSDGFTVVHGTQADDNVNSSSNSYVGWAWDAGTSTASNTDGSITSSVRANASAGISVVGFTGNGSAATIGHGLNAAPELILLKNRQTTQLWYTYHKPLGANKYLYLNQTDAAQSDPGMWNNVEPTSSVFTVGSYALSNNYIAYCFAPVEGFSAFGSYTGNGSDDGPFVFTGFRVAWLMIKNTSTSGETWTIYDSTRDVDNAAKQRLQPNSSDAESVGSSARFKDLLSNGFKIRGTSGEQNTSGDVYIYAAFAEHPFKTARAR